MKWLAAGLALAAAGLTVGCEPGPDPSESPASTLAIADAKVFGDSFPEQLEHYDRFSSLVQLATVLRRYSDAEGKMPDSLAPVAGYLHQELDRWPQLRIDLRRLTEGADDRYSYRYQPNRPAEVLIASPKDGEGVSFVVDPTGDDGVLVRLPGSEEPLRIPIVDLYSAIEATVSSADLGSVFHCYLAAHRIELAMAEWSRLNAGGVSDSLDSLYAAPDDGLPPLMTPEWVRAVAAKGCDLGLATDADGWLVTAEPNNPHLTHRFRIRQGHPPEVSPADDEPSWSTIGDEAQTAKTEGEAEAA